MLKTMKSKVAAGTAAVLLVGGGGVAFGASDAGMKLREWYNTQFGNTAQEVLDDSLDYGKDRAVKAHAEYEGLKTSAAGDISQGGKDIGNASGDRISGAAGEHIDSLKNEHADTVAGIDAQFDKIAEEAQGIINTAGNTALRWADQDLKGFGEKERQKAIAELEKHLASKKQGAVSELQETIDYVKGDLLAELEEQQGATTEEIKGLIDGKINELRPLIKNKIDTLITEQKGAIAAKASELEKDATDEMLDMVNGI